MEKKFDLIPIRVPNFILINIPGGTIGETPKLPIKDFTNEELQLIGDDFTKRLIEHAENQRKQPAEPQHR